MRISAFGVTGNCPTCGDARASTADCPSCGSPARRATAAESLILETRRPAAESFVPTLGEGSLLNGRYRLERRLGRGGMAVVWAAVDERLGRRVAIKTIPAIVMEDKRLRRALEDEARLVMELHHERIRAIYGLEDDPQAGSYLVMELIDGLTLNDVLGARREQKLEADEAVTIALQVCEGLAYAHRRGVIHRDMKPANLFLQDVGEEAVTAPLDLSTIAAKVTDFGLGASVRASMAGKPAGETVGTLAYMSPEQLRGDAPTPAMDVYSVAATLYELLSGAPPFTGEALAVQVMGQPPRPLIGVLPSVAEVVMSSLAKDPADRPGSIASFAESLARARGLAIPGPPMAPAVHSAGRAPASRERLRGFRAVEAGEAWYPMNCSPTQINEADRLGLPLAIEHVASGVVLVLIPGGEFRFGAADDDDQADHDERPARTARAQPFYVGLGPVMQFEWERLMGDNPSRFPEGGRPVECVSHIEVQKFLSRMSETTSLPLRLPTEVEWERAARGLSRNRYWWGHDHRPRNANCRPAGVWSGGETTLVGSFPPNGFGLYDVLGNVWEWCSPAPDEAASPDPGGPLPIRGGSWATGPENLRVSCRASEPPDTEDPSLGLRCAMDVPGPDDQAGR